jgi:hypothetical protein
MIINYYENKEVYYFLKYLSKDQQNLYVKIYINFVETRQWRVSTQKTKQFHFKKLKKHNKTYP